MALWLAATGWNFLQAGWFDHEPFFDVESDREYTYGCLDPALPANTFWVTFSGGGKRRSSGFVIVRRRWYFIKEALHEISIAATE